MSYYDDDRVEECPVCGGPLDWIRTFAGEEARCINEHCEFSPDKYPWNMTDEDIKDMAGDAKCHEMIEEGRSPFQTGGSIWGK